MKRFLALAAVLLLVTGLTACSLFSGAATPTPPATPTRTAVAPPTPPTEEAGPRSLVIQERGPSQVAVDEDFQVSYTISNPNMQWTAQQALFGFALPGKTVFVSSTVPSESALPALRWSLGNLLPGEQRTVSVTLRTVSTERQTWQGETQATFVRQVGGRIDTVVIGSGRGLTAELQDDFEPVTVGQEYGYKLTLRQQGALPATKVDVKVSLPENLVFVSGGEAGPAVKTVMPDKREIEFERIAEIQPNQEVVMRFRVKATSRGDSVVTAEIKRSGFDFAVKIQEGTKVLQ